MTALAFNGAEHEGAGLAAVRAAMDLGVRLTPAQYLAIEQAAEILGDETVYVVVPEDGEYQALVSVIRLDTDARTKRFVGELLRGVGFRVHKMKSDSAWELWAERGGVRRNPKKPQPEIVWNFWHGPYPASNSYLLRIRVTEPHAFRTDRRHGARRAEVLSHYGDEWTYMPGVARRSEGGWSYSGNKQGWIEWRAPIDAPPPSPDMLDPDELRALGMKHYFILREMYEEFQRRLRRRR